MTERLFRVTCPRFVAGFIARQVNNVWYVHDAAPILRWLSGRGLQQAVMELQRRRMHVQEHGLHKELPHLQRG